MTPVTARSDWARTRDWIADHFDGRAGSWKELTADGPLGYIRATVRRGRREMQDTILGWLPEPAHADAATPRSAAAEASGGPERVLDAGCGPGTLSLAMAASGRTVVGVDISAPFIQVARERVAAAGLDDRVELRVGDMLEAGDGPFDHVVCMDSLLHYTPDQLVDALERLGAEASRTLVFTYAPRTPFLAVMHAVGTLLPARNRSPFITPLPRKQLERGIRALESRGWRRGRTHLVKSGFYISQAQEMVREGQPS